jgi:hypothetical protein
MNIRIRIYINRYNTSSQGNCDRRRVPAPAGATTTQQSLEGYLIIMVEGFAAATVARLTALFERPRHEKSRVGPLPAKAQTISACRDRRGRKKAFRSLRRFERAATNDNHAL